MKSLYTSVVVLAAVVALIGSIGATLEQNQASAIIVDWKQKFTELTDEFEKAVSDAAAADPPDPDKIQRLVDDYDKNVRIIFELKPTTEGDPPTEADPPSEVDPPDPDTKRDQN